MTRQLLDTTLRKLTLRTPLWKVYPLHKDMAEALQEVRNKHRDKEHWESEYYPNLCHEDGLLIFHLQFVVGFFPLNQIKKMSRHITSQDYFC